jgi:hypothetical protein
MLTMELLTQIQSRRGQETHIMLIDLQKAFDSVDRELLFELLENTGIDDTVSDVLKSAYSAEQSTLLLNRRRTAPFQVHRGVRQGACSSPILFNLLPDQLAKRVMHTQAGVWLSDMSRVNCLLYADDVALIARNTNELQTLANEVTEWANDCKLKINAGKTEYLTTGARQNGAINLDGTMIMPNDELKYLGIHKNRTDVGAHHHSRLTMAKKTLRNILHANRRLPKLAVKHKLHMIKA